MRANQVTEPGYYLYQMPLWDTPIRAEVFIDKDNVLKLRWVDSNYKTYPIAVTELPALAILEKVASDILDKPLTKYKHKQGERSGE